MVFVQYVVLPATRHHFRIFTFDPPEPLTLNIYRVGNLLFRSKLLILKSDRDAIHFRSSLQKSNREQIVLIALYKRARWANRSCRSLKKNDVSALLIIGSNHLQKTSDSLEKLVCIWQFFPFLCPRANRSLCSSLILSFLKSHMSDLHSWAQLTNNLASANR